MSTAADSDPLLGNHSRLPDAGGHFGPYGGRFVAETLMAPLQELESAYQMAGVRFFFGATWVFAAALIVRPGSIL